MSGPSWQRQRSEYLTVKEIADLLGVSLTTAYGFSRMSTKDGGPPVKRIGRRCIRFPKTKFLKWAGLADQGV